MKRALAWPRSDAGVTVAMLLVLILWEFSGADVALSRLYGGTQGFALREVWYTRSLLHDGGRALAWVVLALLAWRAWRPDPDGPSRREHVYWLTVVLLTVVLVPALKRVSTTSCPWDLAEFGGVARYVPHWLLGQADGGPGHCFPSGHAVSSFAFFGVYFLWRSHRPQRARLMLMGVLAAGALFGWAQLARGAHFASHSLWSAWLCWTLAWLATLRAPTAATADRDSRPVEAPRRPAVAPPNEVPSSEAPSAR